MENQISEENIKVYARFRPSKNYLQHLEFSSQNKSSVIIKRDFEKRQFSFNHVFPLDKKLNNYTMLYDEVTKNILNSVSKGINSTIMAYGQTGGGKTFTIVNEILPQCAKYLWKKKNKYEDSELYLSAVQIYNEKLMDLLEYSKNLKIREKDSNFYIENLYSKEILDLESLQELIKKTEKNRNIGSTSMNPFSSRSHAIYKFTLIQKKKNLKSILNLVDLSGSERLKKANISENRYNETISINSSLTILSKCIIYLSDKNQKHIPFRESKLTKILKESLGGNCKTALIVNLSPQISDLEETLASLCFAQRACKIICKPIINKNLKNFHNSNRDNKINENLKQSLIDKDLKVNELEYENLELINQINGLVDTNNKLANENVFLKKETVQKKNLQDIRRKYNDILSKYNSLKKKFEKNESFNKRIDFEIGKGNDNVEDSFFSQKQKAKIIIDSINGSVVKKLKPINFDTFKRNEEIVKIEEKDRIIQELRMENSNLKQDNDKLLTKVMETEFLSDKNDMSIFKKLNDKNIEIENLKKKLENNNNQKLENEINILQEENKKFFSELEILRLKKEDFEKENILLRKKVKKMNSIMKKVEREMKLIQLKTKKEKRKSSPYKQLDRSAEKKYSKIYSQRYIKNDEKEVLKNYYEEQMIETKREYDDLINILKKENEKLKIDIEENKNKSEKINNLYNEYKEENKLLKNLEKEFKLEKQEILEEKEEIRLELEKKTELINILNENKKINQDLLNSNNDINLRLVEINKKKDNLEKEKKEEEKKNSVIKLEIQNLESEKKGLLEELEKKEKIISKSELKISNLKKKQLDNDEILEELQILREKYEKIKKKAEEIKNERNYIHKELQEIQEKENVLKNDLVIKSKELDNLTLSIEQNKFSSCQKCKEFSDLKNLKKKEKKDLIKKNNELLKEKDFLMIDYINLQKKNLELENNLEDKNFEIENKNFELENKNEEKDEEFEKFQNESKNNILELKNNIKEIRKKNLLLKREKKKLSEKNKFNDLEKFFKDFKNIFLNNYNFDQCDKKDVILRYTKFKEILNNDKNSEKKKILICYKTIINFLINPEKIFQSFSKINKNSEIKEFLKIFENFFINLQKKIYKLTNYLIYSIKEKKKNNNKNFEIKILKDLYLSEKYLDEEDSEYIKECVIQAFKKKKSILKIEKFFLDKFKPKKKNMKFQNTYKGIDFCIFKVATGKTILKELLKNSNFLLKKIDEKLNK